MSCSRGLIPCLLHAVSVNKLILNPRLILQGGDYFTLTGDKIIRNCSSHPGSFIPGCFVRC